MIKRFDLSVFARVQRVLFPITPSNFVCQVLLVGSHFGMANRFDNVLPSFVSEMHPVAITVVNCPTSSTSHEVGILSVQLDTPTNIPDAKWSRRDLNPRPSECHSDALPTELRPHAIHSTSVTGTNRQRLPMACPKLMRACHASLAGVTTECLKTMASIVVACLQEVYPVFAYQIHDAMFSCQSPRPGPSSQMLQWLRLSYPREWVSENILYYRQCPQCYLAVRFDPVS